MDTKPQASITVWWRDRILPVILTFAMCGTFASGLAGWRELAIINVKLDSRALQVDDLETRVRYLERHTLSPKEREAMGP